uniref:Uncharacterized protein n=1 Tax=Nelumbo nucifera TaxID=4432 RepID=A0A822XDS6_NELNU|nr:TPA_asm: hypothetical protein HUJ06_019525 [Nelumbo nucifera]
MSSRAFFGSGFFYYVWESHPYLCLLYWDDGVPPTIKVPKSGYRGSFKTNGIRLFIHQKQSNPNSTQSN